MSVIVVPAEIKKFTTRDAYVYGGKVVLCAVLAAVGGVWTLTHGWLVALPGQVLLGVMFAHAAELQHQMLHGTGLKSKAGARVVGVLLGVPMLISYSRYRALHLIHHRYLGTDKDTEFFVYSASGSLTVKTMLASAWDAKRWARAVRDIAASLLPRRRYDAVIDPRVYPQIQADYQVMHLVGLAAILVSVLSGEPLVITLWLIPLLIAEPVHFLIELPEHILCDRTTSEVFKNTRTIKGSWFSFWLTNGNNFHTEHHLRMAVPIQKLGVLHKAVEGRHEHYCATYPRFYRMIIAHAWRNSRGRTT